MLYTPNLNKVVWKKQKEIEKKKEKAWIGIYLHMELSSDYMPGSRNIFSKFSLKKRFLVLHIVNKLQAIPKLKKIIK